VDGISPDSCRDVVISDCIVKADDDAIVLKASLPLGRRIPCEHIAISNCVISSNSNAIKIGTETSADFRNITVTGCVIKDTHMAGITVQSVDGAHV
jgi:polygalacturonase